MNSFLIVERFKQTEILLRTPDIPAWPRGYRKILRLPSRREIETKDRSPAMPNLS